MEYVTLGRTGVQVSRLCCGTMTFGREADEATSAAIFGACRDAGINFYDCADVYAGGESERILGRLIADSRDELVITSKVGMPDGVGNDRGGARRHIMMSIERSLRRLGTDRLDFYFIHRFDDAASMEQTLRAMEDLVRQGKVLYPAVSNWSAWRIARALGICERRGWARFELMQPMYNLVKRQAEVELLPLAAGEGLGVISYSPLGGGLLTGKYTTTQRDEQGRLSKQVNYTKRYGDPVYYEVAERFGDYAKQQGVHPVTLAVAWVMGHPAITAPIIGARDLEQLKPSLAAGAYVMSDEQRAEISALSIEPPVATDRREEQV